MQWLDEPGKRGGEPRTQPTAAGEARRGAYIYYEGYP